MVVEQTLIETNSLEKDTIVCGILHEDFLGYKKGTKIIGLRSIITKKVNFGLCLDNEDIHWGYFISTNFPKIENEKIFEYATSVDHFSGIISSVIRGWAKIPNTELKFW